jgi:hypothetical protein
VVSYGRGTPVEFEVYRSAYLLAEQQDLENVRDRQYLQAGCLGGSGFRPSNRVTSLLKSIYKFWVEMVRFLIKKSQRFTFSVYVPSIFI